MTSTTTEPSETGPGLAELPGWGIPRPGPYAMDDPTRAAPDPSPDPSPEAGGGLGGVLLDGESQPRRPLTPESFRSQAGAYSSIARALLMACGGWLNAFVAADDEDTAFLPDDDDQDVIPPPLGRLAARRFPLGKLGENYADVEDLAAAAVGLAAWLAKGFTGVLNNRLALRRARKAAELAAAEQAGQ